MGVPALNCQPLREVCGLLRSGGLEVTSPQPQMLPSVGDRHSDTERAWQRGTGVQDMGTVTGGSAQIIFPLPNSKHPHSWPQPSCTSLPGSNNELVPGGIQSELGEISGSRVGEVRDPGLQVW